MWRCILAPDADRGSEDMPPDELSARLERLRSHAAASTSTGGGTAARAEPAQGVAHCYGPPSGKGNWVLRSDQAEVNNKYDKVVGRFVPR